MKKNFFTLKICRCCGNKKLKGIIDLGSQPLANNLKISPNQKEDFYPLKINYCPKCHNCQLSVCVNPKKLFNEYFYLSSVSKTLRVHFINAAKKYIKFLNLKKSSLIIDIGSNDGIGLIPFKNLGFKNLIGVEPAKNLAKLSNKKKIKTFNNYLNNKIVIKIKRKADLVLASNVFAHSHNLKAMAKNMLNLLSREGTLIIEVQYLLDMIKSNTFDNIYHEHFNYWSLTSLNFLFKSLNSSIYRVERINTHGGSIRIFVSKNKKTKTHKNVFELLKKEKKFGLYKVSTYKNFASKIYNSKKKFKKNLRKIFKKNGKIIFFGAPAKATTALNYYGVSNQANCIIEDNNLKQNKFLPGVNIPIYSKDKIKFKSNIVVVLAWNFFKEIKKNNKSISKRFISIKDLQK